MGAEETGAYGAMAGPFVAVGTAAAGTARLEPAGHERRDLAACQALLRHGSRTFLAASRLLPREVREPACVLYAFCRLADDAVDGDGSHAGAVARLRERLTRVYAGAPLPASADRALALVVARHGIPRALFDALLEGFEWDLQGRRYASHEALEGYAARVAGSVGAMMALLMGVRSAEGLARACDLGVAMQLSNIARDVAEDAAMGRLYLPRDWLAEAGIDAEAWLARPVFDEALAGVVWRLLDAADVLYRRVDAGIDLVPSRSRPGINAARLLYAAIGHEVKRSGLPGLARRARVPASRKAGLLLQAMTRSLAPAWRDGGARHGKAPPPALAATRFLVEAAAAAGSGEHGPVPAHEGARRGIGERVVWTLELFARLEQRDRLTTSGSAG